MVRDDSKQIWEALTERRNPDADTYDAEGLEPGPIRALEDEEGPTSNLDNLIGLAAASEDAEGVEDINVTDEDKAFKEVEEDTPL
jgi:3-polyprenyl-4-hydroxybenzoate decarboxylase|tara:strand:+ start:526 stop:780 length:255 start_codon:yes stop_codon:yes gene_type:complete